MKLRNLRAYVPGTDDTPAGIDPKDYETGTDKGILRKINLNVDIATQDELNQAFTQLSAALSTSSEEWKAADIVLSSDLTAWALGEDLSGAIHNEITAEASAREEADQAIRDSLSAYDLSVSGAAEEETKYVYTFYQGGVEKGQIDIAKDIFVTSANFERTILVLHLANGDTISTDLSGLVDVYTGDTTDFADVVVDPTTNKIKAYVSADLISAAAVTEVVGADTDLSSADTVWGAKAYAEDLVTGKNVDASGDTLVSADASDNAVVVGATPDLTAAVALANSAVQDVVADNTILTTAVDAENAVISVLPTAKLTAAVAAAETALQSIGVGTAHDYVTVSIPAKAEGATTQTVEVSVTTADLTAETAGLAEATDVKAYVDGQITDLNVSAAGDDYVTASSTGKAITVGAADRTKAVVDKVEATSATWDAAAPLTALEAETSAREDADSALSTAIDNLSGVYASKTTVDTAATTLEGAITVSALSDYNDIDEIISELETLKAAVAAFATSMKTA